jgi:hypothetical protein
MFVSFFKDFNTMKSDPSLSKRAITERFVWFSSICRAPPRLLVEQSYIFQTKNKFILSKIIAYNKKVATFAIQIALLLRVGSTTPPPQLVSAIYFTSEFKIQEY